MKKIINTLLILFVAFYGYSQTSMSQEVGYEVRGVYKRSIHKSTLYSAKTLKDINPGFPESWIKDYTTVEIQVTSQGETKKSNGVNEILNERQITLLKQADFGTNIVVDVKYKSDNSVIGGEDKSINFAYTVMPETEATYPGGYDLLKEYLKEAVVNKITKSDAKKIDAATISFTIDTSGNITNVLVSKSSDDSNVDNLLQQAIKDMPIWHPAQDNNNLKVSQDFEFNFGNMIGC